MKPNLEPSDPLSQVVFIHDYLQLIFQDEMFNIYNLSKVSRAGEIVMQGQSGFCDAVVALIDQRVENVSHSDSHILELLFEDGTQFLVGRDEASICDPEAYGYYGENQGLVVEPNG